MSPCLQQDRALQFPPSTVASPAKNQKVIPLRALAPAVSRPVASDGPPRPVSLHGWQNDVIAPLTRLPTDEAVRKLELLYRGIGVQLLDSPDPSPLALQQLDVVRGALHVALTARRRSLPPASSGGQAAAWASIAKDMLLCGRHLDLRVALGELHSFALELGRREHADLPAEAKELRRALHELTGILKLELRVAHRISKETAQTTFDSISSTLRILKPGPAQPKGGIWNNCVDCSRALRWSLREEGIKGLARALLREPVSWSESLAKVGIVEGAEVGLSALTNVALRSRLSSVSLPFVGSITILGSVIGNAASTFFIQPYLLRRMGEEQESVKNYLAGGKVVDGFGYVLGELGVAALVTLSKGVGFTYPPLAVAATLAASSWLTALVYARFAQRMDLLKKKFLRSTQ